MGDRTLNRGKDILWAVSIAGLAAGVLRFGLGLGAASGLNDASPWGLWIAFKLGFVALSGGGFTLAAMVYIFHLETYRPILRRAILLALLGYGSFIVSLLFDLGLPWHIYMPILNWQHHSVMFEIAWCVLLYFSVLIMEFGPVILEYPWFRGPFFQHIYHFLKWATVPLVILGIVLSTLHQSSLGALFLIMPHRVHTLWYSAWIPVMFFVSAIGAGMLALIVEGFIAQRLFGRGLKLDLLQRLGKIASFVLLLYLGLRLGDLTVRGVLPVSIDGSWQSMLFLGEVLLGGILPVILLLIPQVRAKPAGLLSAALLGAAGIVSQRMSLSLFTMWRPETAPYTPSGLEILIAFAIPAAAGLIYLLFTENLAVLEQELPVRQPDPYARPVFEPDSLVYQDTHWNGQLARRAGIGVLALALLAAVLPAQVVTGEAMPPAPVRAAQGWEMLLIDGDADGQAVQFPHAAHQARLSAEVGEAAACQTCHHLDRPVDVNSGCWECHGDYYQPSSIFDHTQHTAFLGGNAACGECHAGEHRAATAVACETCHAQMIAPSGEDNFSYWAINYQDALHENCQSCHEQQAELQGTPELGQCGACHLGQLENQNLVLRGWGTP